MLKVDTPCLANIIAKCDCIEFCLKFRVQIILHYKYDSRQEYVKHIYLPSNYLHKYLHVANKMNFCNLVWFRFAIHVDVEILLENGWVFCMENGCPVPHDVQRKTRFPTIEQYIGKRAVPCSNQLN